MTGRIVWACILGFAIAAPAWALLFEDAAPEEAKGLAVLWVRDCGNRREDAGRCQPWQTAFSVGDSQRLNDRLMARRRTGRAYDEVWLASGGGVLDEGIKIGRVLRAHRVAVRVRSGTACVSSCTVAFMGGLFRYVEPGATYQVHSASAFSGGFDCGGEATCYQKEVLGKIGRDPEAGLVEFAAGQQVRARYAARRLLALFQRTLLLPLGQDRSVSEDDREFENWAVNRRPALGYASAAEDARRFRAEGTAALQDIIMRIERDSMAAAIADLRAELPNLSRRAAPALKMIEAMYMTSILETAVLSPETLLRMGYVTKDFSAPAAAKQP